MEERQRGESFLLKKDSKKTIKIELFESMKWRSKFRYGKRNISPEPRLDKRWWRGRYRLKVDGKWVEKNGCKYTFFTRLQTFSFMAGLNYEEKE